MKKISKERNLRFLPSNRSIFENTSFAVNTAEQSLHASLIEGGGFCRRQKPEGVMAHKLCREEIGKKKEKWCRYTTEYYWIVTYRSQSVKGVI